MKRIEPFTWLSYMRSKYKYSVHAAFKPDVWPVQVLDGYLLDLVETMWKHLFHERMTMLGSFQGKQMPRIGTEGGILLVRKIPIPCPKTLRIGDVVVHKDPENLDSLLVRRIAALEDLNNIEMVTSNPKDFPQAWILVKDQCWVLADNHELDFEEARDSRAFGPLYVPHIVGRAIYCVRTPDDHGPVENSPISMAKDSAVIGVEMDIDEMINHLKE